MQKLLEHRTLPHVAGMVHTNHGLKTQKSRAFTFLSLLIRAQLIIIAAIELFLFSFNVWINYISKVNQFHKAHNISRLGLSFNKNAGYVRTLQYFNP